MRNPMSPAGIVRRSITVLLATLATLCVCAVSPAHAAGTIRYVALGDSRAAAPAFTSVFNADGCSRSGGGYPVRVAHALAPASFTDMSCPGARTEDIVDRQQVTSFPVIRVRPIQVSALRRDTTLVTLSIGGNDIDWGSLISPCFALLTGRDLDCRDQTLLRQAITTRLVALRVSLDHVLSVIDQRSPHARVFVIGHGGYYGLRGCYPDAGLSTGDALFVRDFFRRFNATLAASTRRRGAGFVDVAGHAIGHDACAPESRRWFDGQIPHDDAPPNHPTQVGDAAIAQLVLDAVEH